MKKIMFFVLVLAFFVSGTFAQDLPMLRSKDALRVYALEHTTKVTAAVNTSLPSGNNNWAYVPVSEPTAEGIRSTIADINLSADVANPEDSLFIWASASNDDGDPLFFGYRQFSLVENADGSYSLPPNYGDVALTMSGNIPIKVGDNTQSAMVALLDSDGKTIGEYSLDIRNGKVYFPQQLAGENAILAVYQNGDWVYWDITNGSRVNSESFSINLNITGIVGIRSFLDTNINVTVTTQFGVGQNITAELKSTKKQDISVSFVTTERKLFQGAWIKKAGDTEWTQYQLLSGKQDFIFSAEEGVVYYIIPMWDPEDLTEPPDPWTPPNYGGKG